MKYHISATAQKKERRLNNSVALLFWPDLKRATFFFNFFKKQGQLRMKGNVADCRSVSP